MHYNKLMLDAILSSIIILFQDEFTQNGLYETVLTLNSIYYEHCCYNIQFMPYHTTDKQQEQQSDKWFFT